MVPPPDTPVRLIKSGCASKSSREGAAREKSLVWFVYSCYYLALRSRRNSCSVAGYLRDCHAEPKAKHLALASEILRCAQNDIHHLFRDRALVVEQTEAIF